MGPKVWSREHLQDGTDITYWSDGTTTRTPPMKYSHDPFTKPKCPPEECNHHRDELPEDCDCFNISPFPKQNL